MMRFMFVKNSDPRGPKGLVIQSQITLEVSMAQGKENSAQNMRVTWPGVADMHIFGKSP